MWSFASPWMLGFLAAAAIPWFIHLWNRRRFREQPWAATRFLLAALRRRARRLFFENWLLMLLRTLVLVLLAVACADPLLNWLPPASSRGGGVPQLHVLVLDASYSMLAGQGEQALFDQARESARGVVRDAPQGDAFLVLVMADAPKWIVASPAFAQQNILEELAALNAWHGMARLPDALQAILERLKEVRSDDAGPSEARTVVHFFTDLGRTTWAAIEQPDVEQQLAALEQQARIQLHALGPVAEPNAAVRVLAASEPLPTVDRLVRLRGEIQNFATSELRAQRVEWLIDDQVIDQSVVDLPPQGTVNVQLEHAWRVAGAHRVQLRVAGEDAVRVDNFRWLSLQVRSNLRVLCIEGVPQAARFVELALEPNPGVEARIRVTVGAPVALLEEELSSFDAVVLCNVPGIPPNAGNLLRQFVSAGGGLIVLAGDRVEPAAYDVALGGEAGLLPVQLRQVAPTAEYSIDPLEYRHAVLDPFRGNERAGLLSIPVWKYVQADPLPGSQVVLGLGNGDPLVVERRVGRGRCLILLTAAEEESRDAEGRPWTALPTWPAFVPLIHQMLQTALAGRGENLNVLVDEPIVVRSPATVTGLKATVELPDGRRERMPYDASGAGGRWVHPGSSLSGFCRVSFEPSTVPDRWIAVNLETRESDLTALDQAQIPSSWLSGGEPAERPGSEEFRGSQAGPPRPSAFRWLLAGVLLSLLGESLLAWRFAKQA